MSRSRRKTPICGMTTARSEKKDKRFANRKERRRVRLAIPLDPDVLPHKREISNVYTFDKDGKQYVRNPNRKIMGK